MLGTSNHSEESSAGASSDHDSDGTESDQGNQTSNDNNPMMSIFASYYGIETPDENSEKNIQKHKTSIDHAKFDPDLFVKNLLINESMVKLVTKDAELSHEIRTLDGEMQKLVYDNYNKFIKATETIQKMKEDVFAMDSDMASVRQNMDTITNTSHKLDGIMHDKRTQVDKLVRVGRLLNRLEFLSELPEKLAEMIDNKLYRAAVELYNKTISVLTRHSHVLSFKNIKERTELMMIDLTEKVMSLLDDNTLEAVKLTQNVSVLRLMKAPRSRVYQKLLQAHLSRCNVMMEQYQSTTQNTSMTNKSSDLIRHYDEVSNARKFHQSLIVGLIEACKGIYELFSDIEDSTHTIQPTDGSDTLATTLSITAPDEINDPDYHQAYWELRKLIKFVMKRYSESILASFHQFFQRYQIQFCKQKIFHDVEEPPSVFLLTGISPEEAAEENETVEAEVKDDSYAETTVDTTIPKSNQDEFIMAELNDERNSWVMLARQAIADVLFLDSTEQRCMPRSVQDHRHHSSHHHHHHKGGKKQRGQTPSAVSPHRSTRSESNSATAVAVSKVSSEKDKDTTPHGIAFADNLLKGWVSHCDALLEHRVNCLILALLDRLPHILYLCDVKHLHKIVAADTERVFASSAAPLKKHTSVGSSAFPAVSSSTTGDYNQLNVNISTAKKLFQSLLDRNSQSIQDIYKDVRPIADMHEVCSRSSETVSMVMIFATKYCMYLANQLERVCNVPNQRCIYDPQSNVLTYRYGKIPVEFRGEDHSNSLEDPDLEEIINEVANDVVVLPGGNVEESREAKINLGYQTIEALLTDCGYRESMSILQRPELIYFVGFLRKMMPTLMNTFQMVLTELDLPNMEGTRKLQTRCLYRLEVSMQLLLRKFIETNSIYASNFLTETQYDIYVKYFSYIAADNKTSGDTSQSSSMIANVISTGVVDDVIKFGEYLDQFAVACYVVFTESPAPIKPIIGDRDMLRRNMRQSMGGAPNRPSTAGGSGGGLGAAGHNLQLDIERLFSQKISIYETIHSRAKGSTLLNAVIKAALKSTQETMRMWILSPPAYIQIQSCISFVKQVSSVLLKDSSQCDRLVDQILLTNFSRYIGANDISNATDGNELAIISRAVSDGYNKLFERSVLISR